jgi:phosphate transport system ATP-binding protein
VLKVEKPTTEVPQLQTNGGASMLPQRDVAQLAEREPDYAIKAEKLNIYYGNFHAVRDVDLAIERNKITAMIGPSGCGKSTVLRCFNRMNDLIPNARIEGKILFSGKDIYAEGVDPVQVRRHIGMVFQKPNPFPKSIYDNIAWGAKINGFRGNMDELVEESLRGAALWEEVRVGNSKDFALPAQLP